MHAHILILLSCHQLLHFEIEVPYKPHGSMKHHFEQLIHTHTVLPNTDNEKVQTATGKLKVLCEILHLIAQLLGVGHCLQSQSKVSCFRFFLKQPASHVATLCKRCDWLLRFRDPSFFFGCRVRNCRTWSGRRRTIHRWSGRHGRGCWDGQPSLLSSKIAIRW